jgi:uncharacterized phage protein (TIGR02218 family)
MRTIGEDLAAHLTEDATTTCHAWKVIRRDGTVLGFTDHDHDLEFAATTFQAESGYQASDWEAASGLAAPSSDVAGALASAAITEADIAAGRYDGARVEVYLVNWQHPTQHIRLNVLEIGEITRTPGHFRAELRGLAHRLAQTRGRIYARRCDAAFGDGRCGKNAHGYTFSGAILSAPDTNRAIVSGLDAHPGGTFRYGLLTFTSGANDGVSTDIESHVRANGAVTLIFWLPLPVRPSPGDTFTILAGCDKSFATCKAKFDNVENFRGFPHMPGADFSYSYADGDTEHDGGPLYD